MAVVGEYCCGEGGGGCARLRLTRCATTDCATLRLLPLHALAPWCVYGVVLWDMVAKTRARP